MTKNNGFFQWIESGSQALDLEMQDSLRDPDEVEQEEAARELDDALMPAERKKRRSVFSALCAADTKRFNTIYRVLAVMLCAGLIAFMLFSVAQMPSFGNPDTLTHSELSSFYARNTIRDSGAANIICGIILDYRGFDTLGESHVLFIAVCTVMMLLRSPNDGEASELDAEDLREHYLEVRHDNILVMIARFVVPVLLVFGVYVVLNGHLSPGGGFSGGAILGGALLLYLFAYGYRRTERFMTIRTFRVVSCCALVSYSTLKCYHFYTGVNGIESIFRRGTYGTLFSGGMLLPLDIAVGLVVACTMYTFFTLFRKGDF